MKFKAILLALAVAGASASLAFAEDGPHSGTTTSTTADGVDDDHDDDHRAHDGDCRRFVFRGTIAAVCGLVVHRSGPEGQRRRLSLVGKAVTVAVTPDTGSLGAARAR